jgi:hypothetical protein
MLTAKKKLLVGLIFLGLAALTTTYAANITINSGGKFQFGQGMFQIKACDQWVQVGLVDATVNGNLTVTSMNIFGLDAVHCKNTTFEVQVYNGSNPLNLFNGNFAPVNRVLIGIGNATDQISQTYLIDENGQNVGYSDGNQTLQYNSANGSYDVSFASPLALASQVTSITVQSSGIKQ